MHRGLDFAAGRPGAAAIKAAGFDFVVRYLSDGGSNLPGKLLLPEEFRDYLDHDVAVVSMWETTADRMLTGVDGGQFDAMEAIHYLATVIQMPPPIRCIYFAADWDATPEQQAQIDAYLIGAASVIHSSAVGVYGGFWPLYRAGVESSWYEQSVAWSGNNRLTGEHLFQDGTTVIVNGVECDVVQALQPDFGQYPPPRRDNMPDPVWDRMLPNPFSTDPNGDPHDAAQLPASVLLEWAATHAALARKEIAQHHTQLIAQLPALVQEALKDALITVEILQKGNVKP